MGVGTRGGTQPVCASALTTVSVVAVLLAASFLLGESPARAQSTESGFRVYNIVLDGLKPSEVNPTLTPNLSELRSQGTWYEQARAVFPAETIPNHAAMMTGVLPARSGIVGNDYWLKGAGGGAPQRSRMAHPNLLGIDTTTTRLENSCQISTATVQSKGYLWGLLRREPPDGNPANTYPFEGQENADHPGDQRQADYHPNPNSFPGYIIDPDDHTIDQSVMNVGFRPWVQSNPPLPQFAFVNLGDIDRSGHIDQGGAFTEGGLTTARQAALADTDNLIGQLVDDLVATGAWDETVLIFTSDHSMDWGTQDDDVSPGVTSALTSQGFRSDPGEPGPGPNGPGGDYYEVSGGGTTALYVEEPEDVADVARIAAGAPGVALVATRSIPGGLPESLQSKVVPLDQVGMDHPKYGADVVVMAEPGWAFRQGGGNPLPGNHGHPVTQPSVLMVAGGHPVLDDQPESVSGETVYDPGTRPFSPPAGGPGNLSVAPTVAALFGIGEPAGGYDGAPLSEAFEDYAFAPHAGCRAATPGDVPYPRPMAASRMYATLVPAYAECTEPDRQHGPPLVADSCSAPRQASNRLTVGGASSGAVRLAVRAGNPNMTGDEADVALTASIGDVREQQGRSDYAGELRLAPTVRVTDRGSGPGADEPATVEDIGFPVDVPCAVTEDPGAGSVCSVSTSLDVVMPGVITEGRRSVWQLGTINVFDGGDDGDAATEPNSLFAQQGIFVP